MMIGSIGGGGFTSQSISNSLTQSIGNLGAESTVSDSINPKDSSSGLGGSIVQPTTGAGPMLSSDTVSFLLLNTMDSSSMGSSTGSEKGSISEILSLANQAYNAATNLQSMSSGGGISGIGGGIIT